VKYEEFLSEFPTVDALAVASLEPVLQLWQGLGYNRRAVALKRAAETLSERNSGVIPCDLAALEALPGVGPATAAGVLAFAFGKPAPYLETNVRAVYLHEFFTDRDAVPDREILPLVRATLDEENPRQWFYALLDYGWWLKRSQPNPSRRSAHHSRQTPFEGSRRQKRARLLRAVMRVPGCTAAGLAVEIGSSLGETTELLEELEHDGFLVRDVDGWAVA